MKFKFLKSFCPLLVPALLALPMWAAASDQQAAADGQSVKWSYKGAGGPSHWGDLSPEFSTCKLGKNQSPVNISKAVEARLPSIKFDYGMLVPEDIVNTGHSVQVNIRSGGVIKLDDKDFALKQFHFHSPSENMIDHKSYPLEAHFVHVSEDNEILVAALLYQPGAPNPALDVLIKNFPYNVGDSNRLGAKDVELFERSKVVKNYFRYSGSLTTPPCTEGVRWIITQTRPTMSRQQLMAFQKALKQPNSRPVQPLNARIMTK